jgi:hypothetical protein
LNLDLDIKNEKQNYKIGTVCGGGVKAGDLGEGIWLMGFIYEIKKEVSYNCFKWGREGVSEGFDLTNVQCKPIWNHHSDAPCTMNISYKN